MLARDPWRALKPVTHLLVYLSFLFLCISFVQYLFGKLMIGNHPVKIKKTADLPLRFGYDGTFKILQITDMHYAHGLRTRCRDVLPSEFRFCSDLNTTEFVRRLIREERPNFIAFTGDNIFGSSSTDAAESMIEAFAPAIEAKIPWAAVLGNHDQESTMNREELMSFISSMDFSVSQVNPFVDNLSSLDGRFIEIDGFGNYHVQINGASGSGLANTSIVNLYFLDSGDISTIPGIRGYGWIKESQLTWLHNLSNSLQIVQTMNYWVDPPPALAFFHIPIPEVRELWYSGFVGQFQEGVASSPVNSGVLNTFVAMGDVKGVFMGHDHKNDFCGKINGIWLCYGGAVGYHAYGKAGWPRRARIISIELERGQKEWMGVKQIRTWKRLDDGKMRQIDTQVLWEKS
ncbi:putative inactive purple acid phosphatase 28 [Nymphaea thermarum]|nr:putative inactive purple acid phosphatase 28 [Nymphaea thermarum]